MTPILFAIALHSYTVPIKRALLIGVRYSQPVTVLNTEPDVQALSTVLKSDKYGFTAIMTLTTVEETTQESILAGLKKLEEETQPGDTVFIGYSGHGDQLSDADIPGNKNPRVEENDGLDETLVPSDYHGPDDSSKEIRDDVLGAAIDGVAKKARSVVVLLDCCHSGSGTRSGVGLTREIDDKLKASTKFGDVTVVKRYVENDIPGGDRKNVVVFSASASNERAVETTIEGVGADGTPYRRPMGLFTMAMIQSLTSPDFGESTRNYDVVDRARSIVHRVNLSQTPQLEGDGRVGFMDGIVKRAEPSIPVELRNGGPVSQGGKKILLRVGKLTGASLGSVYGLFENSATDPEEHAGLRIATIKLTTVSEFDSIAEVTDPNEIVKSKLALALGAKAFLETQGVTDNALRLVVDASLAANSGWKKIEDYVRPIVLNNTVASLKEVSGAAYRDNRATVDQAVPYDVMVRQNTPGSVSFVDPSGNLLLAYDVGNQQTSESISLDSTEASESVRATIERWSRYFFIKNGLRNQAPDPPIKFLMRLRRVRNPVVKEQDGQKYDYIGVEGGRPVGAEPLPVQGAEGWLEDGDCFYFEVKNTGRSKAYVTLVDLTPDGGAAQLWPRIGDAAGNTPFPPCSSEDGRDDEKGWQYLGYYAPEGLLPNPFRATEPFGRETFQLIATPDPIDLGPLLDRSVARGDKGDLDPISQLLRCATLGMRAPERLSKPLNVRWWAQACSVNVTKRLSR